MPSRAERMQRRSFYARTDGQSLLLNSPDAWVVNNGPVPWAGYSPQNAPSWWMGDSSWSTVMSGGSIGPGGMGTAQSILPAVTRATETIVGPLVRTNWRYSNADGDILTRPLWIDDPMLIGRAPGPIFPLVPAGLRLDGHSFYSTWITHSIWFGRGAFVTIEAADGTPMPGTLRLLNPYLIDVDDNGHWVIDPYGDNPLTTDYDGRFDIGSRTWRLVVLRGMSPNDGRTPEGVLVRHFDTLKLGASVSQYVASTFTSGVPAGFLKVSTANFKQPDADQLKAKWMEAHGSGRKSIAVLSSTVDFQPISISPMDAQAEQMSRNVNREVSLCFNLDPIWLGEGASGANYNNQTDRRRDLVDISLSGPSERIMATLTSLMPYGTRVEVNWSTFTSPNIQEHAPALVSLVQTGILTAREAREFIGLSRPAGPDPAWEDHSPAVTDQPEPQAITAPPQEVPDEA